MTINVQEELNKLFVGKRLVAQERVPMLDKWQVIKAIWVEDESLFLALANGEHFCFDPHEAVEVL